MTLFADIVRFARLGRSDRRVFGEALVELMLCSFVIARLPFARAIAFGSRPVARPSAGPALAAELARRLGQSIETLGRRVPWKAKCFQQGLALQRMLRRRGVAAQLHYGIAAIGEGELKAHVWIAANDQVVMGGETADDFRQVAVFPGAGR